MTRTANPGDQRQSQLEALVHNAVDAILTIDEKGIIQSANPATEKLFGFPVGEVVGRNIKILMPSPFHEEHDGYLANYLQSGEKRIIGIGREVMARRKDGSTFPIHLAVSEASVGDRLLFTGIVRDISDLKEAEKRLEALNDELERRVQRRTDELRQAQAELLKKERLATLGQVSGGIAHEIRNPLNAIKTSAFYLMKAKNPTSEKTHEHLERIDRQVTMIDNVITALSDIARLPAPNREPHSIVEILAHILQTVSLPAVVEVDLRTADDVPDVLVDEHQMPIVFRNLIRNARDAMPDGGKLTIDVKTKEGRVQIDVIDTGHGIPPSDLDRITEPLYSTKARGIGLGLAITVAILDKNCGKLQITSDLGKGSRFRVELEAASRPRAGHDAAFNSGRR